MTPGDFWPIPHPCANGSGRCGGEVYARVPQAPVVCGECAFWIFATTPVKIDILKAHDDENLYFLDPSPNAVEAGDALQIRFFDDTKAVLTNRLRCLGVPPDVQTAVRCNVRAVLIMQP